VLEFNNDKVVKALQTISGLIIEIQNLDTFSEIVEHAKLVISI